jgi:drug/metabolite transporter (DMT)-like permease
MWTISVKYNGAAVSTILNFSSVAFTAIIEHLFFRSKLGLVKILAIVVSILGCLFVARGYEIEIWRINPIGIGIGLLTGVAFSVYSLVGKETAKRGIESWTALFYSFSIAALFLCVFSYFEHFGSGRHFVNYLFWLDDSLFGWTMLIILAAIPTIGGYGLYTLSLRYLQASVANLIATLELPMTAFQAYLILGEWLEFLQIAGTVMILTGVVLIRWNESRINY